MALLPSRGLEKRPSQWAVKFPPTLQYLNRLPTKLRSGNVFTGVSLSFCSGGRVPWWMGPHCTGPPFSLPDMWHGDLPPPSPGPHGTPPQLLVTSGGHHWRSVQTCSLEDPHSGIDIWWPLKHIRLASGLVVRILLECFLVLYDSTFQLYSGVHTPIHFHKVRHPMSLVKSN